MSRVVLRVAICLLTLLAAGSAAAVDVPGTSARFLWTAATGPVSGYVVYVSRNGGGFIEERRVAGRGVRVYGELGETLRVRVAAHDAQGAVGPRSAASDPITFVATVPPEAGGDPTTDIDDDGRSDTLVYDGKTRELSALLLQADGSRVVQLIGEQTSGKMAPVGWADVDGDGEADVLWRDAKSGKNELWLLDGIVFTRRALPDQLEGWSIVAFRDFDKDGKADVLWHDAKLRQSEVWWLDGTGLAGEETLDPGPANGSLVGVADFNGDGFPDLVWRDDDTGAVEGWRLVDTQPTGIVVLPSVGTKDSLAGVGDLDGDGNEDLLWLSSRGKKRPVLVAWFMKGLEAPDAGIALDLASLRVVAVLDLDSDGRVEILTSGNSKDKTKSAASFGAWRVLPNGTPDANGELWWELEPLPEITLPFSKKAGLVESQ